MYRVLIDGHGGREASIAWRIAQDDPTIAIHAVMGQENPTIARLVEKSGGRYELGDHTDPAVVGDFATRAAVDFAVVSNDNALANGVVDALQERKIACVGPDQAAAKVEYDKAFSRQLIDTIDSSLNPLYQLAETEREIDEVIRQFERRGISVVVKPLGLTGGKGVKVMGPHFSTFAEAAAIAKDLLRGGDASVLLEEKIDPASVEYTVQLFTDGQQVIIPPYSVDYPYRYDGDVGPGTGGMGAFTERGAPSYLTLAEVEATNAVCEDLVAALRANELRFKGVLYLGLFATAQGLKFVEANARPGDPECINLMMLLEGNFPKTLEAMAGQTLASRQLSYQDAASVVVYLVNPGYALEGTHEPVHFSVDHDAVERIGAQLFFASAGPGRTEGEYITAGSSRTLAVGALGETLQDARDKVYTAIERGIRGPLDYRTDIGDPEYVEALARRRDWQ